MKLSSRSRYALSALVDLALQQDDGGLPIVELSNRYNISQSSMEQLFAGLRQGGLVAGRRGRSGGYKLAREPENITVAEIVAAVDRPVGSTQSADLPPSEPRRRSEELWERLSQRLFNFLEGITLADVLQNAMQSQSGSNDIAVEIPGQEPVGADTEREFESEAASVSLAGRYR